MAQLPPKPPVFPIRIIDQRPFQQHVTADEGVPTFLGCVVGFDKWPDYLNTTRELDPKSAYQKVLDEATPILRDRNYAAYVFDPIEGTQLEIKPTTYIIIHEKNRNPPSSNGLVKPQSSRSNSKSGRVDKETRDPTSQQQTTVDKRKRNQPQSPKVLPTFSHHSAANRSPNQVPSQNQARPVNTDENVSPDPHTPVGCPYQSQNDRPPTKRRLDREYDEGHSSLDPCSQPVTAHPTSGCQPPRASRNQFVQLVKMPDATLTGPLSALPAVDPRGVNQMPGLAEKGPRGRHRELFGRSVSRQMTDNQSPGVWSNQSKVPLYPVSVGSPAQFSYDSKPSQNQPKKIVHPNHRLEDRYTNREIPNRKANDSNERKPSLKGYPNAARPSNAPPLTQRYQSPSSIKVDDSDNDDLSDTGGKSILRILRDAYQTHNMDLTELKVEDILDKMSDEIDDENQSLVFYESPSEVGPVSDKVEDVHRRLNILANHAHECSICNTNLTPMLQHLDEELMRLTKECWREHCDEAH